MNRQQLSESHRQKKQPVKKELTFVSADQVKFKELLQGVSMAVLWGNDQTGPYGAITRFVPGFDAGMHSHTNDVRIVVIKGAYLYKDATGEKRVGPGDFLFIPGGTKHWSGGDAKEGALFFNEMDGKFDLTPVM
jgi:quercetin dioxygenase-like cupin family protein